MSEQSYHGDAPDASNGAVPLRNRGYAKLDAGITRSSLWTKPHDVLRVWVCLLAESDGEGYIRASAPAMALLCQIPLERFQEIITDLASPDPHSRTPDNEGRRIEVLDGGWRVLNHWLYRDNLGAKDAHAERQRRYRERQKQTCDVTRDARDVTRDARDVTRDGGDVTVTPCDVSRSRSRSIEEKREERASAQSGSEASPGALSEFSKLKNFYPELLRLITKVHPSMKTPQGKTKADATETLERLTRLDGFPAADVIAALRWLFTADDEPAHFWRKQVMAIPVLRRKCKDGASKFARIHAEWKSATKTTRNGKSEPEADPDVVAAALKVFG